MIQMWMSPNCNLDVHVDVPYCPTHRLSVEGCEFYASCVNNHLYDGNRCTEGTLWSDVIKTCDLPFYVMCAEGSARPELIPGGTG